MMRAHSFPFSAESQPIRPWVGLLAWRGQPCRPAGRFTFPGPLTDRVAFEATRPHSQWRNRAGVAPDFPVMPLVGTQGQTAMLAHPPRFFTWPRVPSGVRRRQPDIWSFLRDLHASLSDGLSPCSSVHRFKVASERAESRKGLNEARGLPGGDERNGSGRFRHQHARAVRGGKDAGAIPAQKAEARRRCGVGLSRPAGLTAMPPLPAANMGKSGRVRGAAQADTGTSSGRLTAELSSGSAVTCTATNRQVLSL